MKTLVKRGFSLIELIIVIAVIAVVAGTIIPAISGTTSAAKQQRAISGAEALNLAQTRYRLEKGVAAWDSLADSAARYTALMPYMEYAEASLTAFEAKNSGYHYAFQASSNDHMQKVVLTDPDGNVVPY